MGKPRASRRTLWLMALGGVLLLSLAVLAWGLHDKLSLYTPPHAPPVSAKAKLLSEQERPQGLVSGVALLPAPHSGSGSSDFFLALAAVVLARPYFRSFPGSFCPLSRAVLRPPPLLGSNTGLRPPPNVFA